MEEAEKIVKHALLIERLEDYKLHKARINVLKAQLLKDVSPNTKEIATYGEMTGGKSHKEIDEKETELLELETEIKEIDAAMECLEEDEAKVIQCRYMGKKEHLPISNTDFHRKKNLALDKLAKCLDME